MIATNTKLYPTCSLIMHYLNFDKDEKEYVTMALDTNCKDKDYILGIICCCFPLADQAEKAYNYAKTGKYMNRATHVTDIAAVITRHPAIGFHR